MFMVSNLQDSVRSGRDLDIERAKGVAIIFVVLGHVVARDIPADNEWFESVKWAVYGFHMPFFLFLSGYTFAKSGLLEKSNHDYWSYFVSRSKRFLPPYFIFALIVFSAKVFGQIFLHVDQSVSGLKSLPGVFLTPTISVVSFLWYIWVLYLLQVLFPVLLRVVRSPLFWCLVTLPFTVISLTYWFGMDKLGAFAFFFVFGYYLSENQQVYIRFLEKYWRLFLFIFIASLFLIDTPRERLMTLIMGSLSIPAIHGLCRFGFLCRYSWLAVIGGFSFSIYLMNTMSIGAVKGVLLTFLEWGGTDFLIVLPALLVSGVLIPIAVKILILNRVGWLRKIS